MSEAKNDVFRVAIVTNIVPHYRKNFYEHLSMSSEFEFTIFCQDSIPGSEIKNIADSLPLSVVKVPFIGLSGESIGFQILPLKRLLRDFDGYLILGNPRIVSNLVVSLLLRISRMPVAIWGQAHTANSHPFLKKIRLFWWRQFHFIFLYNEHEVEQLRKNGFVKHELAAMNNGLDQSVFDKQLLSYSGSSLTNWKREKNILDRPIVLSCARLTSKNAFSEVAYALPEVRKHYPEVLWCVIGDGPEKESLAQTVLENGLEYNVLWLGQIYEENQLAPWFLSSIAMVHPEGIGLSLLHGFGYGLPVITSDKSEAQMPEFHTLKDGFNGLLYNKEQPGSLAKLICKLIGDKNLRGELSNNALRTVREHYNTKIMSNRLLKLLNHMAT